MAVNRAVQKSAPTRGLSVNGNSAGGEAASTPDRWYSITPIGRSIAIHAEKNASITLAFLPPGKFVTSNYAYNRDGALF